MYSDDDWLVPLREFDQIEHNLFIGAMPGTELPPQFDHAICITELRPTYQLRPYQLLVHANMSDSPQIPNFQLLDRLVSTINHLTRLGPTLVHCRAGLNRSGLVCAMVLIHRGVPAKDAISKLREKRCKEVLCNTWFENWLLERK